jgi:hypothetical protein
MIPSRINDKKQTIESISAVFKNKNIEIKSYLINKRSRLTIHQQYIWLTPYWNRLSWFQLNNWVPLLFYCLFNMTMMLLSCAGSSTKISTLNVFCWFSDKANQTRQDTLFLLLLLLLSLSLSLSLFHALTL